MEINQYPPINDYFSSMIVISAVIFPLILYLGYFESNSIDNTPITQNIKIIEDVKYTISSNDNSNYTMVSMCVQTKPINGVITCEKYQERPCLKLKNTSTQDKLICEVWA